MTDFSQNKTAGQSDQIAEKLPAINQPEQPKEALQKLKETVEKKPDLTEATDQKKDQLKIKQELEKGKTAEKHEILESSLENRSQFERERNLKPDGLLENIFENQTLKTIGLVIAGIFAFWGGSKLVKKFQEMIGKLDVGKMTKDQIESIKQKAKDEIKKELDENKKTLTDLKDKGQHVIDGLLHPDKKTTNEEDKSASERVKEAAEDMGKNKLVSALFGGGVLGMIIAQTTKPNELITACKNHLGVDIRYLMVGGQSMWEHLKSILEKHKKGESIEGEFFKFGKIFEDLYQFHKTAGKINRDSEGIKVDGSVVFALRKISIGRLLEIYKNSPKGSLKLPIAWLDKLTPSPQMEQQWYRLAEYLSADKNQTKLKRSFSAAREELGVPDDILLESISLSTALELLNGRYDERPYGSRYSKSLAEYYRFKGFAPRSRGPMEIGDLTLAKGKRVWRGSGEYRRDLRLPEELLGQKRAHGEQLGELLKNKFNPATMREVISSEQKVATLKTDVTNIENRLTNANPADIPQIQAEKAAKQAELTQAEDLHANRKKKLADEAINQVTDVKEKQKLDALLQKSMTTEAAIDLSYKHSLATQFNEEIKQLDQQVEAKQRQLGQVEADYKHGRMTEAQFKSQRQQLEIDIKTMETNLFQKKIAHQQKIAKMETDFNEKYKPKASTDQIRDYFEADDSFRQKIRKNPDHPEWQKLKDIGIEDPTTRFATNQDSNLSTVKKLEKRLDQPKTLIGKSAKSVHNRWKNTKTGIAAFSVINSGLHEQDKLFDDLKEMGGSLLPLVGTYLDIKATWTGRDLAGRQLQGWERIGSGVFALAGAVSDVLMVIPPAGLAIRGAITAAKGIKTGAKVAKNGSALFRLSRAAKHGSEAAKDTMRVFKDYRVATEAFKEKYKILKKANVISEGLNAGAKYTSYGYLGYSTFSAFQPYLGNDIEDPIDLGKKMASGAITATETLITGGEKVYEGAKKVQDLYERWENAPQDISGQTDLDLSQGYLDNLVDSNPSASPTVLDDILGI